MVRMKTLYCNFVETALELQEHKISIVLLMIEIVL